MPFIRPASGAVGSYTTTFPATENPLSQGGIFLNGLTDGLDWNDLQTVPGKVYAAAIDTAVGGVQDPLAQLKRSFLACTSNQFSEGTVFITGGYNPAGGHELEVHVNMTIGAHSITGYECYININGSHTLVRWNGPFNNYTPLASSNISTFAVPVAGDVIRLERNGNTLYCYQNGVLRTTAVDTTYMGGNPGLGNNPPSGAGVSVSGCGFTRWSGGSL